MQGDEFRAVGGAEKTLTRDRQAVRSGDWDLKRPCDSKIGRVEHDNLRRLLNISVDVPSGRIVHGPARAAGKRNRRDHPHLVDGDNGYGAIHAWRIADIEHEQTMLGRVVRKAVGAITDRDPAEQRLVRAAIDARASAATIR